MTKVVFKVKGENAKKSIADNINVNTKKKVVKVMPKILATNKKVVLKIKGLKKGKTTLQLKIGKKKAKVIVSVK